MAYHLINGIYRGELTHLITNHFINFVGCFSKQNTNKTSLFTNETPVVHGNLRGPRTQCHVFPQEIAGLIKGLWSPLVSLNRAGYFLGVNDRGLWISAVLALKRCQTVSMPNMSLGLQRMEGLGRWFFLKFRRSSLQISHEKRAPGCLGYIGNDKLPSYIGIIS